MSMMCSRLVQVDYEWLLYLTNLSAVELIISLLWILSVKWVLNNYIQNLSKKWKYWSIVSLNNLKKSSWLYQMHAENKIMFLLSFSAGCNDGCFLVNHTTSTWKNISCQIGLRHSSSPPLVINEMHVSSGLWQCCSWKSWLSHQYHSLLCFEYFMSIA